MSAASDALLARLRLRLAGTPDLVEKRMVGGTCFMLAGNMAVGSTGTGALLVRIDPAAAAEALARTGAREMRMGQQVMTGFVAVDPEIIADDATLGAWVDHALANVRTLPPK